MRIRAFGLGLAATGLLILAVLGTAGCGSSSKGSSSNTTSQSRTSSPASSATTTTDTALVVALGYESAYNAMNKKDNAGITEQNSTDPTTSSAGIQARIAARNQFDSKLQSMHFPASVSPDVQAVLGDDASLEGALGNLEANVGNIPNFNASLQQVETSQGQFQSAATTLDDTLSSEATSSATTTP